MKLKLKKYWTIGRTISQKFNTAFLQDTDKLKKLKILLGNKFQAFHDLCHEVLGHKKHHHKEWITVDTLDKIQDTRKKKTAINTS
ncbi:unnamed protein product [Schistosoma curassoni]|uniref:4a-hydroxytetrahydrobiopterin dehydratase n=1 Tax=Schistosoma curassoni TaxID=6186 RepID=A0A183KNT2_9TREM|nr:unnamed protein product [Schistosoma curassoni]